MTVTINSLTEEITKEGVRVLQKWSVNDVLLSDFMNTPSSTKTRRSATMRELNKLNMLYVVQSKADRSNNIFKVGVSKGVTPQ